MTVAVAIVAVLVVGVALSAAFSLGPYVVTGIADGAIYALAALGLVLTYKTSGIFNFAIGAQAAASAYVFYSLRVTVGLPWPVAALFSMLAVGLVGSLFLERIAYWLTGAPPATKVVATIGLLVMLQAGLTGAYGLATVEFAPFLPNRGLRLFGVNVLGSQLIVVAISIVATVGLYVFFKRARLGVSMQAVVDSPTLLALEATNPVAVRRYAWGIGSCFISISGMLLAPTLGIDVNLFLLIYIAAFGAAAVGAFSSLPITFAAAMGIGVTMNVLSDKLSGQTNLVLAELYTQVPFLVLVAALLLVPRAKLVTRGSGVVRKLRPAVTFPLPVTGVGAAAGIAIAITIPFVVGAANVNQFTTGIGFAVVLASLGLLLSTSGQISLCQMAFAAVGATTFGHALGAGWPWLAALAAAAGVAMAAGAVAAIPSFRLSGVYLAVATFGFGLLLQNLIFPTFLMFGQVDSVTVNRPHLWGLNATSDRAYYFLALVIAALCAGIVVGVRRSRLGRLLRGLSDSPLAREAHGTNTRLTRLYVFCISAGIAGHRRGADRRRDAGGRGHVRGTIRLLQLRCPAGGPRLLRVTTPAVARDRRVRLRGAAHLSALQQRLVHPLRRCLLRSAGVGGRRGSGNAGARLRSPDHRARGSQPGGQPRPGVALDQRSALVREVQPDLGIEHLSVRFGGLLAVDDVSINAPAGAVTGLIGPNGAGKTTIFNACTGVVTASSGRVRLGDDDLGHHSTSTRAARGLGRTFQRMELFDSMTVAENVALGPEAHMAAGRPWSQLACSRRARREIAERASDAMKHCGIEMLARRRASDLSTGQRRLVELARVIATPFRFVLLDEPSSGLDVVETERFSDILTRFVDETGVGLLLVEHDMALVATICSYIYVLDFGRQIFSGPTADAMSSDLVRAAYLGSSAVELDGAEETRIGTEGIVTGAPTVHTEFAPHA